MRRELKHVGTWRRNILPPSEFAVKLLCAVDVRNRYDNDLKLHVHWRYLLALDYILRSCHLIFSFCLYQIQEREPSLNTIGPLRRRSAETTNDYYSLKLVMMRPQLTPYHY